MTIRYKKQQINKHDKIIILILICHIYMTTILSWMCFLVNVNNLDNNQQN